MLSSTIFPCNRGLLSNSLSIACFPWKCIRSKSPSTISIHAESAFSILSSFADVFTILTALVIISYFSSTPYKSSTLTPLTLSIRFTLRLSPSSSFQKNAGSPGKSYFPFLVSHESYFNSTTFVPSGFIT